MTPPESDNPYARPTAYGRMPQAPFRIGPLLKAPPPPPAPLPPPRPGGVLSGSAIPLVPRREAPPLRLEPPEEPAAGPAPFVTPIASARRPAPGRGRWLAAGAAAAILAAAGAAFLLFGRDGKPEPAPVTIVNRISSAPAREAAPPPLPDTSAKAAAAPVVQAPAAKAPTRVRKPAPKAAPKPAPVVETPAPQPPPVIAPPPVLNLPQAAPALREPLDPDAPIPNRIN